MFPRTSVVAALLAAAALAPGSAGAQDHPVALLLEDIEAVPDQEVAVIVRTVADRPLAAASLTIEAEEREGAPDLAFASLVSAAAFSGADDAVVEAVFDHDTQATSVAITSASGTLNAAFGPLLVLRFALEPGIEDDTRFDLRIASDVALLAPDLEPVPFLVPERARLRVRDPEPGPVEVDVNLVGGPSFPGAPAVLAVASTKPFPIGSGTVEIGYDPAFAAGPPVVAIDPRYGAGVVDLVSEVAPGQLVIDFHGVGEDLNATVHGAFLTVTVPTSPDVVPPATFVISIGEGTTLAAPDGTPYFVEGEADDPLEVLDAGFVFRGLFEEGDVFEW